MKKKKKLKGKGGTRYGVSAAKFVEIWTLAGSVDQVMKETGLPKNAVYSRVNSYRKKGMKLKRMPRPNKSMNIDAMNALIDSLQKTKKAKES